MATLSPWPVKSPHFSGGPLVTNPEWQKWLSRLVDKANGPVDASSLTGTIDDARLSSNVALKNAANVFTQDQQITKTHAELALLYSGTGKGRLLTTGEGDIRISRNADFDGTNWNLDNTANLGAMLALNAAGTLLMGSFSAGANPRTQATVFTVDAAGLVNLISGQLQFPAVQNPSANANTLDDYEEGSWTPVDSSGAGLSFSTATGVYTKIGRLVVAPGTVAYPATASGANIKIGGLPFTCSASQEGTGTIRFQQTGAAFTASTPVSQTFVEFYTLAGVNLTNVAMTAKFVAFVMLYIV